MKTCVILNPWAGRGAAGQRRPELEAALRAAGAEFDLVETHARGGATELTYQALDRGYDCVAAVGGDGTINEVVNGLVGGRERLGREAALGIVPLGTGSDFVKVLDGFVPNDIHGAVRRLAAGRTRPIDLGKITVESPAGEERRHFINGLGMGLDAQVAVESLKLTGLKGFAVYLMAIIRALGSYKANVMTVRFDEYEVRRRLLFASVASGRSQGGGFLMTPEAMIDDGLLDICIVEKLRLDQIIRYLPKLMEGTHTTLREVTMGRARSIEVLCANGIPVATDGEVVATHATRVRVEVQPGAVSLVA
ncbi:diacylglycerol kinase family lipid kinase [Oscillochloris sp. ZM17-4]|uniref:diacylglycerol/lipid kinase family protein n=1 Tax=Oscillochloris sp. ZM17-4 TaxID=2866714 RepID=UPI001C73BF49|nr:diacylglycerol kinase family protein [Oscillochloris sp. ZM17-4]MBX0327287.1 diacylglycerol kinase family lipid kinase [Oscillochloris sp. ZM17-4]